MGARGERAAERPAAARDGEHRALCTATAAAIVAVTTGCPAAHDRGSDDPTDEPPGPNRRNEQTGLETECGDASNDGRGHAATAYGDDRGLVDDASAVTGARAWRTRNGATFA